MNKVFKYSVIAVEHPEREITYEICFERNEVIHPDDQLDLKIHHQLVPFRIAAVSKVDHIKSPNDQFDFRLVAVGLR